jgi:hypothetical protein
MAVVCAAGGLWGLGCGGSPSVPYEIDDPANRNPDKPGQTGPEDAGQTLGDPTPGKGNDAGKPSTPTDGGTGPQNPIDSGVVNPDPNTGAASPLVDGLSITEIAVLQGVKVDVMKTGAKTTTRAAPVVSKRSGLVRVFVAPKAGYTPHAVTAELRLASGSTNFPVIKDTKTLSAASTDATLGSTFNFDVPGDSLPTGVTYSVALTDPAKTSGATDGTDARYPQKGSEALDTKSSGDQLKVVVVPVKYNADGSGRLPPTDAAQLEMYRNAMYQFYPAAKVEVTVHAPYAWPSAIAASGSGFSQILQAMVKLRAQDNVGDDVYYFGAFTPAATFSKYCAGGCVAGLSGVGTSSQDAEVRASVGIGFAGEDATITMAHELGHAHGRQHSPCGGAAGPDPSYPYAGGGIGVWGYNIVTKALINPSSGKDLMGYCSPEWISDYTYNALFKRMATVNQAAFMINNAFATPRAYRFVNVEGDGALSWGEPITLDRRPNGELHQVEFEAADGASVGSETAHYYAYDHLPGGFFLVPEGPAAATRVAFSGPEIKSGLKSRLAR